MADKVNSVNKISPFFLMILLVVLIISLSILYFAVDIIFIQQAEDLNAYSFLAIGFFGLALSIYMLMQIRGTSTQVKVEVPRVLTTLECTKCDFKSIRDFQRGDYIFKQIEPCQKCEENMKITAIYREAEKKK